MSVVTLAVRNFLRTEVKPYFRHRGRKPLHVQLAEMYRLWRYWRYAPYQYVNYELTRVISPATFRPMCPRC